MKLCNITVNGETHPAVVKGEDIYDLRSAGFEGTMNDIIRSGVTTELKSLADGCSTPVEAPVYGNILEPDKIICVGFNYPKHASGMKTALPQYPILFSKFADSLVPTDSSVFLPPYESTYDYEGELVVIIGRSGFNIPEAEAMDYVFGYTVGNDISCRAAQNRTSQFLCGKASPGFGPCGPNIVTADEYDISAGKSIRSYVNGELRQDGNTSEMLFSCARIISYASKYLALNPGDIIFTGTPSGVALERGEGWLTPGDVCSVTIEGIGTLVNTMI